MKQWYSLLLASLLIGCGGSSDTPTNSNDGNESNSSSRTYKGFGSQWFVNLTPTNFQIQRKSNSSAPIDLDVNGTYNVIPATQYLDMTVTTETVDTNNDVNISDPAIAIEVPSFGLYLHAINQNAFVAMSNATTCPTTTVTYNYIPLNPTFPLLIGTVTYDPSAATLTTQNYDYNGGTIGGSSTATGVACNSGVLQFTLGGDNYEAYISASGAFTAKNYTNNITYVGVKQQGVPAFSTLQGSYSGMHFSYPLGTLVYTRMDLATPTAYIHEIDTDDNYMINLLSINWTTTGLPTGFVKDSSGNLICAVGVDINPGKHLFLCKESDTNHILYSR